jgi:hypothetical protein
MNINILIYKFLYNINKLKMRRLKKIFLVNNDNISDIPPDTEYIVFDDLKFNVLVTKNMFPSSVKRIKFNKIFYQPLKDLIPEGVEHIELGFYTDIELDIGDLPQSLLYLLCDVWFSNNGKPLKIGVFPDKIKYLNLGSYNHILEPGLIPNSVTKFVFQDRFNQPFLQDSLPKNLKELILGKAYNQPFTFQDIPYTLTYLKLGEKYTCDLCDVILSKIYLNLKIHIANEELYLKTIDKVSFFFKDCIFNIKNSKLSYYDFSNFSNKSIYTKKNNLHIELIEKIKMID